MNSKNVKIAIKKNNEVSKNAAEEDIIQQMIDEYESFLNGLKRILLKTKIKYEHFIKEPYQWEFIFELETKDKQEEKIEQITHNLIKQLKTIEQRISCTQNKLDKLKNGFIGTEIKAEYAIKLKEQELKNGLLS